MAVGDRGSVPRRPRTHAGDPHMNMQETIASSNDALSHIIRLGRSRARWRMLAVALMAMLAGIAIASFD